MDYIVFSSLRNTNLRSILISYDLHCQWKKKLRKRHQHLPPDFQIDFQHTTLDGAIPKFHLRAHKEQCHSVESLNYRVGVGRTDGEMIERDWAAVNAAAKSTKEMGEGARHDSLDDVWGDWNYSKIISMSML
jgi:hypothetical protein